VSQQQNPPRPMSCISSLNHTNEFSIINSDQTNANHNNNNSKGDKFAERLNAMLNYDQLLQDDTLAGCLSKSTSLANFQQLMQANSINKQFNHSTSNRSLNNQLQNTSTTSNDSLFNVQNYSQSSNYLINKNSIKSNEFNSQIQELSNKNMQAQQKLKILQFEQHQINEKNNKPQQQNPFSSDDAQKQKVQRDALEKLKREQIQLKEQISSLNKQRESAQNELEVLATSSTSSLRNNDAQNAIMKHLSQLNENVLSLEHDINDNTPSLSPIQLENNFQRLIN
jgi:hypothetical protein